MGEAGHSALGTRRQALDLHHRPRRYNVALDPSVMVALVSMIVLEGWQSRLDPEVSVIDGVNKTIGSGIYGWVNQFDNWRKQVFG